MNDAQTERKLKIRASLLLMNEYCKAFGLKPTAEASALKRWRESHGSMIAASFLGDASEAPVVWVTAEGALYFEQDEDLLQPNEAAISELDESVVRVSINLKKPIHPVL